jgi:hypothetical protein
MVLPIHDDATSGASEIRVAQLATPFVVSCSPLANILFAGSNGRFGQGERMLPHDWTPDA